MAKAQKHVSHSGRALFPPYRYAYYQNVMHYSAYSGISIECDV